MPTYPPCASLSLICETCNSSQSRANCAQYCSSTCDAGYNTSCKSAQSFCRIASQLIEGHADVPAVASPSCYSKDEFIHKAWTAKYWNDLRERFKKASGLGLVQKQGNVPIASPAVKSDNSGAANSHPQNSLITADKYNEVIRMMNAFNQSLPTVKKDDVIKAAHAIALVNGTANAKFNINVCDICNAGGQRVGGCGQPCACFCGCPCSCPCPCSNPTPAPSPKSGPKPVRP